MYLLFLFFAYCGKLIAMEPFPIDNIIEGKNEKSLVSPCTCVPQKKENEKGKIYQASSALNNDRKKSVHSFSNDKDVRKILVLHSSNCNINDFVSYCWDSFTEVSRNDTYASTMFKADIGGYDCELIFIPYEYYKLCEDFVNNVDIVINLWTDVQYTPFYRNCEHAEFLYKLFVEKNKKFLFFICFYGSRTEFGTINAESPYSRYSSISEVFKDYLFSISIYEPLGVCVLIFKKRLLEFLSSLPRG